jgi:hypothetical protein
MSMNETAISNSTLNHSKESLAEKSAVGSRLKASMGKLHIGGWLRSILIVGYILTVLVIAGLARA